MNNIKTAERDEASGAFDYTVYLKINETEVVATVRADSPAQAFDRAKELIRCVRTERVE